MNRMAFRNFDEKAKATVDFVGALETSGLSFNMLPSARAPANVKEAIMYWADVAKSAGERANTATSHTYRNVVSRAVDSLGRKVGNIGPFEARTVITYRQVETRSSWVFWSKQVWVTRTKTQDVNGPLPGGLFNSRREALDAGSGLLVDRIQNLKKSLGGSTN